MPAQAEVRKPRRLRQGDTVAIVAPATPWEARSELLRAVAGLEAWGLEVVPSGHARQRPARLPRRHGTRTGRRTSRGPSGSRRSAPCSVSRAATAPPGWRPILDREAIAANPKPLCGYSDITTLHLAIQAWAPPVPTITFYSNGASGVGAR